MSITPEFNSRAESWQPMVAVALCFVVGVVMAWSWSVDVIWLECGIVAVIALYLVTRWRWVVMVGVVLSGMISVSYYLLGYRDLPDNGIYVLRVVTPRDVVVEGVRGDDGRWLGSSQPLLFGCDSTLELRSGDRVVVEGRVRHFSHRGYIYISERNILEYESDAALGAVVNSALCRRMDQLGLNPESSSLVEAMLLGNRRGVDSGIMRSYRRSGAAHLLAVSGLHIGIIASILAVLLLPLLFLYRGHIFRLIAILLMIWVYAYVVGMSASVLRATIMYSFLLISSLSAREYNPLNILSLAILVMTLFNPPILFDVGFQLSVVSVAAIILWVIPLWSLRRGLLRSRISNYIFLPLLIGFCCTVATLPIISYTFGSLSLFGVLLNPLLLITTYLILALSMMWLIVGFGLLAPLFKFVIELCVSIQNGVVGWAASGWRDAIDFRFEGLSVVLIYVGYVVLTIEFKRYIKHRRARRSIK